MQLTLRHGSTVLEVSAGTTGEAEDALALLEGAYRRLTGSRVTSEEHERLLEQVANLEQDVDHLLDEAGVMSSRAAEQPPVLVAKKLTPEKIARFREERAKLSPGAGIIGLYMETSTGEAEMLLQCPGCRSMVQPTDVTCEDCGMELPEKLAEWSGLMDAIEALGGTGKPPSMIGYQDEGLTPKGGYQASEPTPEAMRPPPGGTAAKRPAPVPPGVSDHRVTIGGQDLGKTPGDRYCITCRQDLGRTYTPAIECEGCKMAGRYEDEMAKQREADKVFYELVAELSAKAGSAWMWITEGPTREEWSTEMVVDLQEAIERVSVALRERGVKPKGMTVDPEAITQRIADYDDLQAGDPC